MNKERRHVVITGVGRSGTTFLIKLLTFLDLPTGFLAKNIGKHVNKISNAGLERSLKGSDCPYIVKDPIMCEYVEDIVESDTIKLDHVYIPIRNLEDSAKSRVLVSEKKVLNGGMWKTGKPDEQACILAKLEFKLLVGVSKLDVPVTFLHFPTIVKDPLYLYNKLTFLVSDIPYEEFEKVFYQVANPDLLFSASKVTKEE